MLAYIFWHRPSVHVDRTAYEAALLRFLRELAAQPPPGLIAAASFSIEPVPWLSGQSGYEDWYLLSGSWAMDPLNGFAVAGRTQTSHDAVAAQAEEGHGGLYARTGGEVSQAHESTLYWLNRPRGIQWRAALEPIRKQCPQAAFWRRQMVLSPTAEFAVEIPNDVEIAVPAGWQASRVKRLRLPL